jgi:deoxyribonuclease V
MVLAVDVYYFETFARAVAVLFEWEDEKVKEIVVEQLQNIEAYIPGEFYKRELPCILKVLEKVKLDEIQAIVVDGYVYLDNNKKYGLGAYLWEALGQKIPVIGVAKKTFHGNEKNVATLRHGQSQNTLYVSAIGIELETALGLIGTMHGDHRIPSVLKYLDQLTREETKL